MPKRLRSGSELVTVHISCEQSEFIVCGKMNDIMSYPEHLYHMY